MRPSFTPRLVNDPFSDPGLFIPFLFERRALLFDLGDLHALSSRDLLKVSHVFVTHTHMDHFIGFDHLLRVLLGRKKSIHIFGPPDFFRRVEGRLSGYTWNLVQEYPYELKLRVAEVHQDRILTKTYLCRKGFQPERGPEVGPFGGVLLKEPSFRIEAALLDHRIPCLGLSLVENYCINIIKEELKKMKLPLGPWLTRFKRALYEGKDLGSEFPVTWEEGGLIKKARTFLLGELAERITRTSPGQKITYITDVIGSPDNREKMVELAKEADNLFIEAAFLDSEREIALKKYHLTAREAGEIARRARVKHFTPFHFSPRYQHMAEEIRGEATGAFSHG
ncbi:MAG: ribonuclease Z [Deltaproteobacteria bacterium]|nr:ribonuclease Z [Deltaproteobacteria bacterium]MBW2138298.1 ribonuclease Z [Deltaproteobacteria bacterium]